MPSAHQIRILFAGGCHLVGYPVGAQHAFPLVIARQLELSGITCQSQLVPYVPLHHPEKVVEACRLFQPDILLLQLGNYELGNELSQYLLSRLGFKRRKKSSSPTARGQVENQVRYTLQARLKQGIDWFLGHPLVDFTGLGNKYQAFLDATANCARQVVVSSPTPCADPTSQYYRRRAMPMFEAVAREHNCVYVNLTALDPGVGERTLGRDRFFADAMHLGIAGQTAVGQCFAVHIRTVIENAAIKI